MPRTLPPRLAAALKTNCLRSNSRCRLSSNGNASQTSPDRGVRPGNTHNVVHFLSGVLSDGAGVRENGLLWRKWPFMQSTLRVLDGWLRTALPTPTQFNPSTLKAHLGKPSTANLLRLRAGLPRCLKETYSCKMLAALNFRPWIS